MRSTIVIAAAALLFVFLPAVAPAQLPDALDPWGGRLVPLDRLPVLDVDPPASVSADPGGGLAVVIRWKAPEVFSSPPPAPGAGPPPPAAPIGSALWRAVSAAASSAPGFPAVRLDGEAELASAVWTAAAPPAPARTPLLAFGSLVAAAHGPAGGVLHWESISDPTFVFRDEVLADGSLTGTVTAEGPVELLFFVPAGTSSMRLYRAVETAPGVVGLLEVGRTEVTP